ERRIEVADGGYAHGYGQRHDEPDLEAAATDVVLKSVEYDRERHVQYARHDLVRLPSDLAAPIAYRRARVDRDVDSQRVRRQQRREGLVRPAGERRADDRTIGEAVKVAKLLLA